MNKAIKEFYRFNRKFKRGVDAFLRSEIAKRMSREAKREIIIERAKRFGFRY